MKLYLLDVEGTVAPMSLVTEQLFPYARAHFESFLREGFANLQRRARTAEEGDLGEGGLFFDAMMPTMENREEQDPQAPRILPDLARSPDPHCASMSQAYAIPHILEYVYWLMDHDRKSTALKSLQGKIWKSGFESGELKGTLFDDVPEAFQRWAASARVAIYSSGSIEAQQLLFRHSTFGDLTPWIAGYFDTRTGLKTAPASYAAIGAAMHVAPTEIVFFSDAVRELDAAREAGCATRLVVREGNAAVDDPHGHSVVESFQGL